MPWRVVRVILDHRTMIPNPLIFFASILGGVIVGIALDALLDWPWWLVALSAPAGVWLIFLASVVPGRGAPRELRMELLDIVSPAGIEERHQRHEEEVFRSAPFKVYGLDASWTGLRMLGGYSTGVKAVAGIELTHGDMSSGGPWVRVGTEPVEDERLDHLHPAALELWHTAERPPADLPPRLKGAWIQRRFEEGLAREANWTKVSIPIDGTHTVFDCLYERNDWVALAVVDHLVVKIRGHEFPIESVRLAVVKDVEPYIKGSRRFNDEQRRRYEEMGE